MERFTRANGNGQSQCYNCGTVCWDTYFYIDTNYTKHNRLCEDCKKVIGTKEFLNRPILWSKFKPYHREKEV